MSLLERVKFAADLVSGDLYLEPSLQQASELVHVPQARVRDELKQRAAALETDKDLPVTSLVEAWSNASDAEREAAVRLIGPANVWDALAAVIT
jgi:hypothetical protein